MSNALKRKSKKNTFFTKQDTKIIGRNDFEKRNADKVITKSYKDFVVIGYIVLHDKFGFGRVRQQRFLGYLKTWIRAINMDDGTLAEILEIAQKEVGYDVHFLEGGK